MEDVSLVTLFGRLAVSLAVVIGLMVLTGKFLRRRGMSQGRGAKPGSEIEVLSRHGVGRNASVAVVRISGKSLVLGITESSVSVLREADPPVTDTASVNGERAPVSPRAVAMDWRTVLETMRERTVRRS